ncbi:DEAD-box ATP-dependent RNA helicase 39 [Galdieria sulphuraria]|uniref:ATP-dependent RNA helicase isoform 1 n=1 Tax=Galdieria sulphuraria TaxID=130081 RepID=M2W6B9_GALSU|nr:ATP-dependent RNA helicase isoform 2 [Galdieria sulphuraria]XP_005707821.1 ATP-dependent RNA helicase isoform 1 [Galdieria sulphuraria]EME31300.1 ATP-dependent RNA helicase isoform 2 [Galdieria sulphuraria]EME31301.1 ATP-dependent RNA helicase isoform 1 [Galdieria sulphuraria]GJD07731.1 DEAD-box ATP-dependent RNA helicase 39 [Galdieria sulphuraria]|eukprot:XP_005707820.1 ATP-dependent RNA helicase isoform 2 [Galdieria sulphuraria]
MRYHFSFCRLFGLPGQWRTCLLKRTLSIHSKLEAKHTISPFASLGIGKELLASLDEQGIHVPTQIQNRGIPKILTGSNVFIGAETGSGKTLTFLLPLVELLTRQEKSGRVERLPNRPRCLVFAPTRELGEQICKVAKKLSHRARFSCTEIVGGRSRKAEEESLSVPRDLVVATPGRFLEHNRKKNIMLSELRHIVFDEADYLFSRLGFREETKEFLLNVERHAVLKDRKPQMIGTAALKTLEVDSFFHYYCPSTSFVLSDKLHQLPLEERVRSEPLYLAKVSEKRTALEKLVKEISKNEDSKTIVFCNTVDSCRFVDHVLSGLNEKGECLPSACYHGEMPPKERRSSWIRFCEKDAGFLVCTDLGARGLDVPSIGAIIMFDFPKTAASYLHRVGRIRNEGVVYSLITHSSRKLAEMCLSAHATTKTTKKLVQIP